LFAALNPFRAPVRAVRSGPARVRLWLLLALTLLGVPAGAQTAPDTSRAAQPAAPRALLMAPAGDTLGTIAADAPVQVVGRDGEWARVRVEGWVRVPAGTSLSPTGPIRNLSLRSLREDPDRFQGRVVAWRVQFIGVQTADSLRTDFRPGEPYVLAREPDGEPGFVYLAVPAALLPAVRRLTPLQRVQVVGRVRTSRSPLMGHPVLELLELRP
jgi:hypothetical protein